VTTISISCILQWAKEVAGAYNEIEFAMFHIDGFDFGEKVADGASGCSYSQAI
jgi:hypothetical protein